MTKVSITFGTPGPIDPVKMANDTEKALKLLRPWWGLDNKDPSLAAYIPISELASSYVRAIDSSVLAAQQGYNVSEDALELANSLGNKSSPAEQKQYANSMLTLAHCAYKRAEKALQRFRDIRVALNKLLENTNNTNAADITGMNKRLEQLKNGVEVLHSLEKNVVDYISWWNWMSLQTFSQLQGTEQLNVDYSSLRDKHVVRTWGTIREAFVQYTLKIAELQDDYPKMFVESRGNSRELQNDDVEETSDTSRTIKDLKWKRARVFGAQVECLIM